MDLARDALARHDAFPDGVRVPPVAPDASADPASELHELGLLSSDGTLSSAWSAALGQHLRAQVRATLRARAGLVGGTTGLTVVEDRALLVHDAVRGGSTDDDVAAASAQVEVLLARVEDLWPAVASTLPPFEVLTAGAERAAPAREQSRTVLDAQAAERMRTGTDVASLPPVAQLIVRAEQASVTVTVEAWPTPAAAQVVWSRWWSVADGRLFDVQMRDDHAELVERGAGDVAAELRWALVGAIDATTRPSIDAPTGGAR
ncbi:hypothetical protein [Isoptericola croceus]|uniref:hypothetical protein n=1 Tax=Isoptericola croceus TaxID=3031406 RepID=UPI0023F83D67|nr:hypothetical protein [Isoptericola croceus]